MDNSEEEKNRLLQEYEMKRAQMQYDIMQKQYSMQAATQSNLYARNQMGKGSGGSLNTMSPAPTPLADPYKYITKSEYEMFIEARNFITDLASDEDLPASYRDQAKRMIARLILSKV